jgi:hypothetical protein
LEQSIQIGLATLRHLYTLTFKRSKWFRRHNQLVWRIHGIKWNCSSLKTETSARNQLKLTDILGFSRVKPYLFSLWLPFQVAPKAQICPCPLLWSVFVRFSMTFRLLGTARLINYCNYWSSLRKLVLYYRFLRPKDAILLTTYWLQVLFIPTEATKEVILWNITWI